MPSRTLPVLLLSIVALGLPLLLPTEARAEDDLASLLVLTKHRDPAQRLAAIRKLGALKDPGALDRLIELLSEPDPAQREEAARALGQIGDRRALAPLTAVLLDPSVPFRNAAADGLGALGDPGAVDPLIAALVGGEAVRNSIVGALVKIGEPAIPALVTALASKDPDSPPAAAAALGGIGGEKVVAPLVNSLKTADRRTRCAAAEALGKAGQKSAIPALSEALKAKIPGPPGMPIRFDYRVAAATALGKIGDKAALPALNAAAKDRNSSLSRAAKQAIDEINRQAAGEGSE
jgi:HEAT repeat protein